MMIKVVIPSFLKQSNPCLKLRFLIFLSGWMLPFLGMAQDTAKTLTPDAFLNIVRTYHPVVKQAGLLVQRAEADLLSSRGAFDPSLYFNNEQKTFDGKNYYNYNNAELKLPTWFGVEVKAGVEGNYGERTGEEVSLGKTSYAGLMVPLAKNLMMDKRRAALQQAKLFIAQSKQEQLLYINDLLFEAIGSYWQWVAEFQYYKILSDAVKINEDRYKLLKITVEQGDRPAVDTTEALAQLLNFKYLQNEAFMNFQGAGYELSNYLWQPNNQPYILPQSVVPEKVLDTINPFTIAFKPLNDLLSLAASSHPKLNAFQYKIDALEVERKLKFQSLLPTLNVKYNLLNKGYQVFKSPTFANNYKFGVDIGMPLFLRQGRGEYKAAKIKLQSADIERSEVKLSIENKVKFYYNQLINQLQQIKLTQDANDAYLRLFKVEEMRFGIGESTLFLLNTRENKVLESAQKLAGIKAKFFKSRYAVQWAAGLLR
jgi:outer membrane protein TolC